MHHRQERTIIHEDTIYHWRGASRRQSRSPRAAVAAGPRRDDHHFWVRASEASTSQPLVKAYNATHATQVSLNLIPDPQFATKFSTASAGGTVPDVAAIDLVAMPSFAAAGQMMDITTFAHTLPHFAQLSPSHVRLATYQGKLYGVPYDAESSILIYNKNLFRQAGLNPNRPPTTWGQIEADSKKIRRWARASPDFISRGTARPATPSSFCR
jgi:multiple sugar transport system substrate-binding protein